MEKSKTEFMLFRKALIKSIERPVFLEEDSDNPTIKNLGWNGVYNILLLFSDAISSNNLPKQKLRLIIKQIEDTTNELDTFLDSKQLLMLWIFIGSEIDAWIELCLQEEYYESAANLKKIMDGYFND